MNNTNIALKREQIAKFATAKQAIATQTEASVWVSASAGTGKTYVLTNRIIKLLLNDPSLKPSQILALTFTKAASQEMANRIRERLSEWALANAEELNDKLAKLLEKAPTEAQTARAKQLFQLILTEPVNVNTIHGFCQKLLTIFPLESNISPNFKLMDDVESTKLIEQATKQVIKSHSTGEAQPNWVFELYLSTYAESTFADNITTFIKGFHRFNRLFNYHKGLEPTLKNLANELGVDVNITPGNSQATKAEFITTACTTTKLKKLAEYSLLGGKRAGELKIAVDNFLVEATTANFTTLHLQFIGKSGKPKTAHYAFGKKVIEQNGYIEDLFLDFQQAIATAMNNCKSVDSYLLTKAYLHIGWDVITQYNTLKSTTGNLDFDDLIQKAVSLLQNTSQAEWVRYKMDKNINHVLLDEAQDTDSNQWQIIQAIISDFFNGIDTSQNTRTFFAVGDIKQSIYRFRGAEPQVFATMRKYLNNHQKNGYKFNIAELQTSFRSSEPILTFVDEVFANEKRAKAVDNLAENIQHQAFNIASNGKIEIWPLVELPENKTEEVTNETSTASNFTWQLPKLNNNQQPTTATILAEQLATSIKELLNSNTVLTTTNNHVNPADIMVLLRNRTIMPEIIAALNKQAIPHTGADEINLHNDQICEDLINLLKFIANPSDSLSLASTMRSPMFAFTDNDLLELYSNNSGTHWGSGTLWGKVFISSSHPKTKEIFLNLLNCQLSPYNLIIKALELTNAKGKYICRLSNDNTSNSTTLISIEESINAFLNTALTWGKAHGGTLDMFIHNFLTTEQRIKRELSNSGNSVRLMTAHKSKGLEAPIVYLPDTNRNIFTSKSTNIWQTENDGRDTLFLHKSNKDQAPKLQTKLKEAEEQRIERDELRLLYVAITRAKEQLYIGGTQVSKKSKGKHASWYSHIEEAITENPSWKKVNGKFIFEQNSQKVELKPATANQLEATEAKLPNWATTPAPAEPAVLVEKASDSLQQKEAIQSLCQPRINKFNKGKIVHKLLEILPNYSPEHRQTKGQNFLQITASEFSHNQQQAILTNVLNIINTFPQFFAENSKAEVAISAPYGNKIIEGIIDRLIVETDKVTIIDYKTNNNVPDIGQIPTEYKKQMGLYSKAIQTIYPNKIIQTKIMWTSSDDLRLEDVLV